MKTEKSKITLGISTEQKINAEFVKAWKQAEKKRIKKPEERIYFLEASTLLAVLSDKRMGLLHFLYDRGKSSVRHLSKLLHRNYRNVYDDVQLLKQAGLVLQLDKE